MTVLRESPWYQEILSEGKTLGLVQGLEQGLEQGEKSLIIRQLTRQVGAIAPEMISRIQSLSLAQIDLLGEALLDFEQLADLHIWLERH